MIKRRFYKDEHGDKNEPSSDSSSSSDSEVEAEATEDSEGVGGGGEDDLVAEAKDNNNDSGSSSSGYESEDGSANEIDGESSDFGNEDDETAGDKKISLGPHVTRKHGVDVLEEEFSGMSDKESVPVDISACVLKFKSVYKCRICPRIVCLTEESMRAHLSSKRHIRSEKLLKENRLKVMLNSDGEIENQETASEMHARIIALAEDTSTKKNKGRQRQRKRLRKKVQGIDNLKTENVKQSMNSPAKRRRKK